MEAEGEAMRTLYVEEVVDTLANGGDPVVAEKYYLEKLGVDAGVKSFRNGSFLLADNHVGYKSAVVVVVGAKRTQLPDDYVQCTWPGR